MSPALNRNLHAYVQNHKNAFSISKMFVDKLTLVFILICEPFFSFKFWINAAEHNQQLDVEFDDGESWKINYQSLGEIE